MRVAIIGAGIAGLSAGYFLIQKGFSVEIFDANEVVGASHVPSLLLHPFLGKKAQLSYLGKEAFAITSSLVEEVERFLGKKVSQQGLFRLAEEKLKSHFQKRAEEEEELVWCKKGDFEEGLWFEKGKIVFSASFFEGFKQLLKGKGAKISRENIYDLSRLRDYDRILIAAGQESLKFFPDLNLERLKGQALLCRTKEPISFAFSKDVHIVPTEDPHIVQVGSTYERGESSFSANPEKALFLLEKAKGFYKPAEGFEVVDLFSSARLSQRRNYLPLVKEIQKGIWLFTAFGSRGMLYAPFFAKHLENLL